MKCLIDTNVMIRWALLNDPLHTVASSAIEKLVLRGDTPFITPQNLVEFWALATRPISANGLGLSTIQVSKFRQYIEDAFTLLPEDASIYTEWRYLVEHYGIVGRQVYDTRLVAVMLTAKVTDILTFNGSHFRRFSEITVLDPVTL